MSDHEFEKQVHQKMEELKLRPSDTVWMEVQKKIRQDKRRRRFLWLWIPMLFICLSTSAYILYRYSYNTTNTTNNQAIARVATAHTAETTTLSVQTPDNKLNKAVPAISSAPSINNSQPKEITPAVAAATPVVVVKETTIAPANKKPVQPQQLSYTNNNTINNIPVAGIHTITPYSHEKPRFRKKKTFQDQYTLSTNENSIQPQLTGFDEQVQPVSNAWSATMPAMVNNVNTDIATNKAVTMHFRNQTLHSLLDSLSANQAIAPSIPRNKPSLWFYGITANAGYSRISENKLFQLKGLLGQDKYLAEDLSARSSNQTAGTSSLINYTGATASAAKNASPIQPDLAFSAGFFVQRILSPRFKLSLGIEYTYMSVNTEVGRKVVEPTVVNMGSSSAAVVPEYYKSAGSVNSPSAFNMDNTAMYNQKYRYRFQYIEVPLKANWQINKGIKSPPIVFEGGFSVSRLISVNALHYEGIKGIYYQDNSLFNKTSVNFITGISVGLLQHSKHPIWIGPDLRYSLNGLVKRNVSTGQYLWSTGISVKMLLGKL